MPRRIFLSMLTAVATFLVLAIIVNVFHALIDTEAIVAADGPAAEGSILHLDIALLAQLAIQWFNVLLVIFFLMNVLYNPVKKFMADRAERIGNEIDAAKRGNQEAQALKASYEEKLAGVEKERGEILVKARREATEEHDRILFDAQEQAKHLLTRAADEIKMERENAADEVRRQIIEVATLMATRFVEVSIDAKTRDKYVDEALGDWSERTWQA